MPTSEQVNAIVEAYASGVSKADKEAIMACYSADAIVQDPYPGPVHEGHDAVGGFWDGVLAMGTPVSFVPDGVVVAGDRGVFSFTILLNVGEGAGRSRLQLEGYDIFTVNDDGLISDQLAYWDPAKMLTLPLED